MEVQNTEDEEKILKASRKKEKNESLHTEQSCRQTSCWLSHLQRWVLEDAAFKVLMENKFYDQPNDH